MFPDSSLVARLENAVEALVCGSGNLRERLTLTIPSLAPLIERDFPTELQSDWSRLRASLSRPDPDDGPFSRSQGLSAFNLHIMSGSEKRKIASTIFRTYRAIVRWRPPPLTGSILAGFGRKAPTRNRTIPNIQSRIWVSRVAGTSSGNAGVSGRRLWSPMRSDVCACAGELPVNIAHRPPRIVKRAPRVVLRKNDVAGFVFIPSLRVSLAESDVTARVE